MCFRDPERKREYEKSYQKQRYHRRRQYMIDRLGGECKSCGGNSDLEIDHVDPATKSFDTTKIVSDERMESELDKCQLLCRTCHLKKSQSEGSFRKKLDETKVARIKYLWSTGEYVQREIASIFGVDQKLISNIIREKIWKQVPWPCGVVG